MRNIPKWFPLLGLITLFSLALQGQKERILLDGHFADWENRSFDFKDATGDGRFGYDFGQLIIENDENHLFFSFDTGIEINLQENNDLVLILDTDSNDATGYPIDDLGAELIYYFAERAGAYYTGNERINLQHEDIGLVTLPTVSGDRFEIALSRNSMIDGHALFPGQNIRCMLMQDVQNGDKIPDQAGGLEYIFSDGPMKALPGYTLKRSAGSDFRILSYNVLQDRLFESTAPFERQITAMAPDILAFQEIYDHSAAQTKELVASFLGGSWFAAKQGTDIILVSRFPILESHFIAGNGAFLLDVNGKKLLLINAHLPCCDNDSGRQEEVDAIMAFIRNARNGQSSLDLVENTPIVIAGDMNFVGKNRQLKTFFEGDIQNEFVYGPDFAPDWDGTRLQDVLNFATETPLAITWYDTYSSYNPGRLDYIFYTDAVLTVENGFNLFTQSLPTDTLSRYTMLKKDTQNAADHIPVIADFRFGGPSSVESARIHDIGMLMIYPQPFNDILKVIIPQNASLPSRISIFDLDGREVFAESIMDLSPEEIQIHINSANWSPGPYVIRWIDGERIYQNLVIKGD